METEYMLKHSIPRLLQWITSEIIENEPTNPIQFINSLTEKYKNHQYDEKFVEQLATGSMGKLEPESTRKEEDICVNRELEQIVVSLENITAAFETDSSSVILEQISRVCDSEWCYLYSVDEKEKTCSLNLSDNNFVLQFGEGIVGLAAETKDCQILSGEDCIKDPIAPHFDFVINSMIACPVFNKQREVVGVVQIINDDEGRIFSDRDQYVLSIFATQLTTAIHNKNLFAELKNSENQLYALLDLIRSIKQSIDQKISMSSLMFQITRRTHEFVASDRATLFVVDACGKQMWAMQGEINISIPLDNSSLAGSSAVTGKIINIPDAYKDKRFNPAFDKKSGYHTKTILCVPMKTQAGVVVGVLQLINKLNDVFNDEDSELLDIVLMQAAPSFSAGSGLQRYARHSQTFSTDETMDHSLAPKHSNSIPPLPTIGEDEGEN